MRVMITGAGATSGESSPRRWKMPGTSQKDNDLVFPNSVGKPMNPANLYSRFFKPLLERAGLADKGFTFHSLRHTFATTLAAKGVHPSTAKRRC